MQYSDDILFGDQLNIGAIKSTYNEIKYINLNKEFKHNIDPILVPDTTITPV